MQGDLDQGLSGHARVTAAAGASGHGGRGGAKKSAAATMTSAAVPRTVVTATSAAAQAAKAARKAQEQQHPSRAGSSRPVGRAQGSAEAQERRWVDDNDEHVMRQAFEALHRSAKLAKVQRRSRKLQALRLWSYLLQRKVMTQWREVCREAKTHRAKTLTAYRHWAYNAAHKVLKGLQANARMTRLQRFKAERLRIRREAGRRQRVLSVAWATWAGIALRKRERADVFARDRLLWTTLSAWRSLPRTSVQERNASRLELATRHAKLRQARSVLQRLRENARAQERERENAVACVWFRWHVLMGGAMRQWRKVVEPRLIAIRKARTFRQARARHLEQQVFAAWSSHIRDTKEQRFKTAQALRHWAQRAMGKAFGGWLLALAQKVSLRGHRMGTARTRGDALWSTKVAPRILRQAWFTWSEFRLQTQVKRVRMRRADEFRVRFERVSKALAHWRLSRLRASWRSWLALHAVKRKEREMATFASTWRRDYILRQGVSTWLDATAQHQAIRDAAIQTREARRAVERADRVARIAFHWRNLTLRKRLERQSESDGRLHRSGGHRQRPVGLSAARGFSLPGTTAHGTPWSYEARTQAQASVSLAWLDELLRPGLGRDRLPAGPHKSRDKRSDASQPLSFAKARPAPRRPLESLLNASAVSAPEDDEVASLFSESSSVAPLATSAMTRSKAAPLVSQRQKSLPPPLQAQVRDFLALKRRVKADKRRREAIRADLQLQEHHGGGGDTADDGVERVQEIDTSELLEELVEMQCRRADLRRPELVLDNAARKVETGRGLVVYVSFAENATKENAQRLARLLIGLNLSTTGRWGDGTKTQSVGAISASGMRQEILVVPQACLTSKVKGKQLRYAAQLSREDGFALYTYFLAEIEQALLDHFLAQAFRNDESLLAGMCMHFELETIRLQGPYCSFDKRGVPTARAGASDGHAVPLSKSERKAFDKLYRALSERVLGHAKWAQDKWEHLQIEQQAPKIDLIPGRFRLIAGTFGNRQGLTIEADCGPSTHVLYV
ncbi:Hypothetical Protein FCC1311_042642 [Hondaea fermentalgiana]|uniref:Uncharacterized protein n=1 Tax=Hondaea fermentalgiana TaxID=2315210 RepID=A0A2R5GIC9_9STRA|nr:Hypothetical Protein FCC1311_042642 [Hondaea fermentalgiana]|eukprot:GBG28041.1 Hypothetical Protein FCC1311_042642 [Hondaea fermentalgiana]